jgi:hypothetical protein
MSPIYSCANQECVGIRNLQKPEDTLDDSAKCAPHSFILYQPESWKNYPTMVRNQYGAYLWRKEDKEAHNEELFCEELCSRVLDDRTLFSQLATELAENYDRYKARAIRDYVTFQMSECGSQTECIWPDFAVPAVSGKSASTASHFDKDFQPPGTKKIKTIFDEVYRLVEPYLLREHYYRPVGKVISWDATFDFMSKTMNDIFCDADLDSMNITQGQWGHILFFGFMEGEKRKNNMRIHYILRKRMETLYDMSKVMEVQVGISDVCCEQMKEPQKHWFQQLWPGAISWPRKDMFHAMKLVTGSLNQDGELYWSFRTAFNSICMKYDQERQKVVAKYYVKKESLKGVDPETVIDAMMRKKNYRKKIPNRVADPPQLHNEGMELFNKFQNLDEEKLNTRKKLASLTSGHSSLTGLVKEGAHTAHL